MKQFNLEEWLQDKSRKVVTRDGKPVRIVCWDSPNKGFPIVGFIDDNPTVFVWDTYGYALSGHRESNRDLFFAEEEDELTEFEQEIKNWMSEFLLGTEQPILNKTVKQAAKNVLDLARNEVVEKEEELTDFESDLFTAFSDAWQQYLRGESVNVADWAKEHSKDLLESARKELMSEISDFEIYEKGFKVGKEYALKDLPKWKKAHEHLRGEGFIHYDKHGNRMTAEYAYTNVEGGEYYLNIDDLKSLPKE